MGIGLAAALALWGCDADDGADAGAGGMDAGAGVDAGAGGADAGDVDAGGGGTCTPACGTGRDCCEGECTNLQNDPRHCGGCGTECGDGEICQGGACGEPACETTCGAGETCCGSECCGAGTLCCDPQGPVEFGPSCVTPDARGTCPVGCAPLCMCAAPDTPIATPGGERAIAELAVGDLVYSVEDGAIVAVPIVQVHRQPVTDHRVMRVRLDSGVTLSITGGHPTADGRRLDDLAAGDALGEAGVVAIEEVPYPHAYTHDILPGSTTGAYFAGGALIGSTLGERHGMSDGR